MLGLAETPRSADQPSFVSTAVTWYIQPRAFSVLPARPMSRRLTLKLAMVSIMFCAYFLSFFPLGFKRGMETAKMSHDKENDRRQFCAAAIAQRCVTFNETRAFLCLDRLFLISLALRDKQHMTVRPT